MIDYTSKSRFIAFNGKLNQLLHFHMKITKEQYVKYFNTFSLFIIFGRFVKYCEKKQLHREFVPVLASTESLTLSLKYIFWFVFIFIKLFFSDLIIFDCGWRRCWLSKYNQSLFTTEGHVCVCDLGSQHSFSTKDKIVLFSAVVFFNPVHLKWFYSNLLIYSRCGMSICCRFSFVLFIYFNQHIFFDKIIMYLR